MAKRDLHAKARLLRMAGWSLRRIACELDVCVLEFDHVGKKTGSVMQLARQEVGLARLSAEIQRCEVRCVNCHRRRTARAAGAFRARAEYPQRELNSRYEVENLAC